tara:strand:- start:1152 stop:1514 length:363 start_codon:yes stop_codon:yes gene_type:complete
MTFLFDTICDDIIGEITKYIVWTKRGEWDFAGNCEFRHLDNNIRIQRLLMFPLEKPIITLDVRGWQFTPHRYSPNRNCYEVIREVLKNKIKTNKKGLIQYRHKQHTFGQIDYTAGSAVET